MQRRKKLAEAGGGGDSDRKEVAEKKDPKAEEECLAELRKCVAKVEIGTSGSPRWTPSRRYGQEWVQDQGQLLEFYAFFYT